MNEKLIKLCPSCGSGDIYWCVMSVRPYCRECNEWGSVNYGNEADAIRDWNNRLVSSGMITQEDKKELSKSRDILYLQS